MRKFTRLFDITITIWIFICAATLLIFCLWSLDRGLDLSDESYYLAVAIHPDAVTLWATAMHWFTSILWQLSSSLTAFRGIGLAILSISSIVLAIGTVRAFQVIGVIQALKVLPLSLVAICSLTGALLYHAFVPFTPSYNLLAVSGVYMAMGLVSLTAKSLHNLRFYCFQLFAGVALGIAFLAKFSSGTIAWIMACVVTIILGASSGERILRIGLITVSMAVTVAVTVLLHTTFSEALAQFRLGSLVYMLGANETFSGRLIRYFNETKDFLKLILTSFAISLILFGIHAIRPRFWIALAGLSVFSYTVITQGYLLGGMDRYDQQTAPLLVAVVLSLLATAQKWKHSKKAIFLIGILTLFPFCVSIGTYNALHTQILFSLAPWTVLVGVLAFGLPEFSSPRHTAPLICTVLIMTVTSQVLTNGFRMPYRLYRPLSEQTEAINIFPLGTFRVDNETRDSFIKLAQLANSCGIHKRQAFLGLYNIPGVALIIQAVPVGIPILQDRPSTEPVLDHLMPDILSSAVVGIDRDSGSYDPSLPKQLATFPTNYRSCGAVTFPYQKQKIELWVRSNH